MQRMIVVMPPDRIGLYEDDNGIWSKIDERIVPTTERIDTPKEWGPITHMAYAFMVDPRQTIIGRYPVT